MKANTYAMPELLEEVEFSDEEINALARNGIIERRRPLYKIRDKLTGFRGKSMILSELGLNCINRKIPGPKIFIFLDFDNMGPPNDFGLGEEINEFLRYFGNLAREMFADIPNEFLRLGGDEFGIFLPETEEAIERYGLFFEKLEEKRKELFEVDADDRLEQTFETVHERTEMRSVRKSEEGRMGESFTVQKFVSSLEEAGATVPPEAENFSDYRKAGILQKDLAAKSSHPPRRKILTNSRAAVRLEKDLNLDKMLLAQLQIEKFIKQFKPFGKPVPNKILEIADVKNKEEYEDEMSDKAYEIRLYKAHMELFEQIRQAYLDYPERREELERLLYEMQFVDPAITSILRLDLVKDQSVRKILDLEAEKDFTVLTIDVFAFGAINNNEGYLRADSVLREIVRIVKETIRPQRIVRLGGGCLKIIKSSVSQEELKALWSRLNDFWQGLDWKQTTLAEASERQALSDVPDKPLDSEFFFHNMEVQEERVRAKPNQSMAQLLGGKKR